MGRRGPLGMRVWSSRGGIEFCQCDVPQREADSSGWPTRGEVNGPSWLMPSESLGSDAENFTRCLDVAGNVLIRLTPPAQSRCHTPSAQVGMGGQPPQPGYVPGVPGDI